MDLITEGLKVSFDNDGAPQIQNMLPYNPQIIMRQASEMCLQGDHKNGIRLLQEVSEFEECRKIAYINLANAYLDILETDKALEYCQKSLKLSPNDPFVHQTLYKIYVKIGNIKTAEKHLIIARSLAPDATELNELETDVLAHKNQLDEYNKRMGKVIKSSLQIVNAPFYFEIVKKLRARESNAFYSQEYIDIFSDSTDVIQDPVFIHPYNNGFLHGLGYETRPYNAKQWKGENLTNKRILVFSEQGLGDNIWLLNLVKKLKKQYNCYIKFATYNQLHCIIDKCYYVDEVLLPVFDISELTDVDYTASIFSLLQYISPNWEEPWLPEFTGKKLPNTNKKKVIVNWLCKANLLKFKPINMDVFSTILNNNLDQCEFFACQRDLFSEKMNEDIKKYSLPVTPVISSNLDDMFSYLGDSDLVFTIDTLHPHAAGALGKKTLLILSKNVHLPTWGTENTVPYYKTILIIRNLQSLIGQNICEISI
jgi:tetratricopeptide (TPR) repeat protein